MEVGVLWFAGPGFQHYRPAQWCLCDKGQHWHFVFRGECQQGVCDAAVLRPREAKVKL
jgi:hypothetical protein